MDIDPKTIVYYPLFTLVLYLILAQVFSLPFWTIFIAIGLAFLYIIIIVIIELHK
ncbi:hypothetical protein [Alkalibacterium sp. MB6]|uniref:hypothetical protein n=1 Tax=Alkalibacterium sp. MB6 TaxID=2081965 RepID=UPI00137A39EF|nr:hypothetical protein [Alkalibacterium sp. MB6]